LAGLWAAAHTETAPQTASAKDAVGAAADEPPERYFGVAMVFVLYAFGGWSDGAFVAAEVRNRRRNLPLALVGGVVGVTVIYLVVNVAYLSALGFEAAANTRTPAADTLARTMGDVGARAVSALVMISALGAINGMILSRARVFAVLGADHRILAWLGGWNPGQGAPRASLAAQAAVTLAMVVSVGTERGRDAINAMLRAIHAPAIDWNSFGGGFDALVAGSAPVFWTLFLGTGIAMIVLRQREPNRERPFTAPFYPLTPLIFCGTCAFMLYRSALFAGWLAAAVSAPVAAGIVLYWVSRSR
jgi:amino acid transporter